MQEYRQNGSWYLWIHAWSWEPSQKAARAHEQSISCFENWGSGASLVMSHWNWCGVPTWANPADAPSRNKPIANWYASFAKASFYADRSAGISSRSLELNLLCEPLSIAAQPAREHVRKLDSSGAFSCSELKPAYVDNEISQMTHAGGKQFHAFRSVSIVS